MKRKLNLDELSLELPKIDSKETRFLLGGDDYNVAINYWWTDHQVGGGHHEGNDNPSGVSITTDYDYVDGHDEGQDQGEYIIIGGEILDQDDVEHDDSDQGDQDGNQDNDQGDEHPINTPVYIRPLNQLPQIEHQLTNSMCVASSFEYIREIFTGQNDSGTYLTTVSNYYQQLSGQFLIISGVQMQYANNLVNHFFFANQLSTAADIFQALANGNPVLAFQIFPDGSGHAITIVGYDNATGALMYADTITGQMLDSLNNPINLVAMWEITGVRP